MCRPFLLQNSFCLVVLVMLMTSIGARSFNPYWMSHEFEHDRKLALSKAIEHSHAHQLSDSKAQGQESLSEAQHQLLHSSNFEPAPIPTQGAVSAIPSGFALFWLTLQAVPPSMPERTFRPPRIASTV